MDDAEVESGLFAIYISDNEDDKDNSQDESKADRTGQTEEQFQEVKRTYRVKVENGELWKQIPLPPLSPSESSPQSTQLVTKPQAQSLLHAVEELYFLRRYTEGAAFVRRLFGDGSSDKGDFSSSSSNITAIGRIDDDTRKTLRYYQAKCEEKTGHQG
ncbi:hypothetical protein Micbo1qcDRAFT_20700 [Microdochium bolleyi]|uniref:Uncharacterized protein n=1 Tax=Microdochium bolleyi TaxID=196109 RepID=A0A136IRQ3_9PEZI|nr:hypothetical protein Micbo1qcDRAFT_20700 [Microdochium bolleyi]